MVNSNAVKLSQNASGQDPPRPLPFPSITHLTCDVHSEMPFDRPALPMPGVCHPRHHLPPPPPVRRANTVLHTVSAQSMSAALLRHELFAPVVVAGRRIWPSFLSPEQARFSCLVESLQPCSPLQLLLHEHLLQPLASEPLHDGQRPQWSSSLTTAVPGPGPG